MTTSWSFRSDSPLCWMGSVRLELARGMDVNIDAHTTLGSVRNSYPIRAAAPTRLVLTSEMGSIRIDEASMLGSSRRLTDAIPRSETPKPPREDPELDRILKMVEAGELSAKDAGELLRAIGRV